MNISQQWKTRPQDERFESLHELRETVATRRAASYERNAKTELLHVKPSDNEEIVVYDERSPTGGAVLSHYAFTQLCARAKAPSGFLRTMPAELAAHVLEWSLSQNHEPGDSRLLLAKEPEMPRLRAITSGGYGRIWDLDVVDATIQLAEHGSPWALADSGLSDRGLFIFLVNAAQSIQLPGDAKADWRPGVYIQNSETGKDMFDITSYLYNPVKDMRLLLPEDKSVRIRHNRRAPLRFLQEAQPELARRLSTEVTAETHLIEKAQARIIGETPAGAKAWLQRRGFDQQTLSAVTAHLTPDDAPTLWAVEQALLDAARSAQHIDERVDLEKRAAKLLRA